jgi:hypothetical protein
MLTPEEKEVVRKALQANERMMFAIRAMAELLECKLDGAYTLSEFVGQCGRDAIDAAILADRELNKLRE